MPSHVIKPTRDPDEDFYVIWSTVVDAPVAWGPRDWLCGTYLGHGAPVVGDSTYDPSWVEQRFANADEFGTSARWPGPAYGGYFGGWDDHELELMEVPIDGADRSRFGYSIPRHNLLALIDRLAADRTDLLDLVVVRRKDG